MSVRADVGALHVIYAMPLSKCKCQCKCFSFVPLSCKCLSTASRNHVNTYQDTSIANSPLWVYMLSTREAMHEARDVQAPQCYGRHIWGAHSPNLCDPNFVAGQPKLQCRFCSVCRHVGLDQRSLLYPLQRCFAVSRPRTRSRLLSFERSLWKLD